MRNGSAAWFRPNDQLAHEMFVVAADLDGDRKNARIRLCAVVDEATINEVLTNDVVEERVTLWDKERKDFVERVTVKLDRMRLSEDTRRPSPNDSTVTAIMEY
jgi:ATP-dependent helicase HrpB